MSPSAGRHHIALIVEGRGDAGAAPTLLRKYLHSKGDFRDILGKPITVNGVSNILRSGGIEGFISVASCRPGCVGILVILDSDDDCVVKRGTELAGRARNQTGNPCHIALAEQDFEDWIYASAETLGLGFESYNPEIRGLKIIKKALRSHTGGSYPKPTWQPRLVDRMDIEIARSRSKSLDRMLAKFDDLLDVVP